MSGPSFLDAETYAQFGLAGMILGVFFVVLIFMMRWFARSQAADRENHRDIIKGIVDRLSSDAKENSDLWRVTVRDMADRADTRERETAAAVTALSNTLHSGQFCRSPGGFYGGGGGEHDRPETTAPIHRHTGQR